jgi:cytochrome c2
MTLITRAMLTGALALAALVNLRAAISRSEKPAGDDDLKVSGMFEGVPSGATRYVSRSALLGAPGVVTFDDKPSDSIPSASLTVLPLERLLESLPTAPEADAVVLVCADRWESFIPVSFIKQNHPYLLLKYAGRTPAQGWPMFGPTEATAPYYCGQSRFLGPPFDPITPYGEFDATQVVEIRAVNTARRYAPFYAGALGTLSPEASEGRKLFLRECNNCHQGPGGVGGNTSQRPLSLLEIHASLNTAYFRVFVRNPKKFYPQTVMPAHGYFTDEMMNQLIAFLDSMKAAGVD